MGLVLCSEWSTPWGAMFRAQILNCRLFVCLVGLLFFVVVFWGGGVTRYFIMVYSKHKNTYWCPWIASSVLGGGGDAFLELLYQCGKCFQV